MSGPNVLPMGAGRLGALEALWALFMNDAMAQLDSMVADGWPADLAVEAVRATYVNYIVENVCDAVELGVAVWAWS